MSASQALLESQGQLTEASGLVTLDSLLMGEDPLNARSGIVGGFQHGKVNEIWGPISSGKTSLLLNTAVQTLLRGSTVTWLAADTPLHGRRLRSFVEQIFNSSGQIEFGTNNGEECLSRFKYMQIPSLSHLLALVLHPPPEFLKDGTSLLVIEGINTVIDLDYPRFAFLSSNGTEQQKWLAGRRYAVLGSLVTGLNKLAILNDLAIVVSTGCISRTRPDSGLGSSLAPGVGGTEWDSGIWNRLVLFRDFNFRCVGLQKCQGRSFISREQIGEVGRLIYFEIEDGGMIRERPIKRIPTTKLDISRPSNSPLKPRKRTYDEIADSEDEDDEYGWDDDDEYALAL